MMILMKMIQTCQCTSETCDYNRTFSYDEIDRIIEGILSSKTLDTKSAKDLIEKVENTLTTKFYKKVSRNICKVP